MNNAQSRIEDIERLERSRSMRMDNNIPFLCQLIGMRQVHADFAIRSMDENAVNEQLKMIDHINFQIKQMLAL